MFSCAIGRISWRLENEFESATVNQPSVFESLKFYCILCEPNSPKEQGNLTRGPRWLCITHLLPDKLPVNWPFGSREVHMDFQDGGHG